MQPIIVIGKETKMMFEFPQISKGNIYLVGGAVRDFVMGLEDKNHDEDYVVIGATKESLKNDFPDAEEEKGKSFPVLKIKRNGKIIDIAMGRKEKKTGVGTRGFNVEFGPEVTLEDDLSRRDLTMNAMAMDSTGKIIDPFGGINDIKQNMLRHVTQAFSEDPLRVYRLARFAAQFDFEVHDETNKLASDLSLELYSISKDRVMTEFIKVFKTKYPWRFFEVLEMCNCKDIHFTGIEPVSYEKLYRAIYFGADDILIAAMLMLESLPDYFKSFVTNMVLPNHYWSAAAQLRDYLPLQGRELKAEDYEKILGSLSRGTLGIDRLLLFIKVLGDEEKYWKLQTATHIYNTVTGASLRDKLLFQGKDVPIGKEFGDLLRKTRIEIIEQILV